MAKSKHRPRSPRSGGNTYLKKRAEEKEKQLRRQDTLTQMMLDAMVIAANETFGRKGDIIRDLCANTMTAFDEIARMSVEDAKDDPDFVYAKSKLDERLKYILGDDFQPWEERYGG